MLYISRDEGRIYEEVAGAAPCQSCGEKTVICPHQARRDLVIPLPKDCTHLKVSRPWTHIAAMEAKLMRSRDGPLPAHVPRRATGTAPPEPADTGDRGTPPRLAPGAGGSPPWRAESSWQLTPGHDFSRLEGCFQTHLVSRREALRIISLDRCLSFTQRLLATLLWEEEHEFEAKPGFSIQAILSALFNTHYTSQEIGSLALQDFLAALQKYAPVNKVIALLGHVLCGTLDPSVLRYALLIADLLTSVSLVAVGDFRVFASQVYPFLQEDDLQNLALEFSAFSENRMSGQLLLEYILKLILQDSEPLFREECIFLKTRCARAGRVSAGTAAGGCAEGTPSPEPGRGRACTDPEQRHWNRSRTQDPVESQASGQVLKTGFLFILGYREGEHCLRPSVKAEET
ncbi:uncharacterized protein LOC115096026 isoform X2 [Rhinatrema bivittatum]|uniref:uncharacterized protein LOC115096026 isoform X2 n=1 Tax=Rhinatrema bivittatum TaxID=194408 RepID=UPI00112B32C1|nr:uncharacterized protein LOC115096026 isoform X2 [Rhinatrema bivittatum]